jgi:glucokinase
MENNIKTRVVGVDISIERTTCAVIDIRGNIIAESFFSTMDFSDINSYVSTLCEKIMELVMANGGYETIRSVGVSAPSANFVTGCIENAPNLPWKGVIPLAALMRDQLGLAVGVANDAHATALGELAYGSAHGMKDFIVLNIGVGLGSCFFSEGHEHHGAEGFAGEFGHTCVAEGGRMCTCGHEGCIESYVSARGIVQTAQEVLAEIDAPSLMRNQEKLSPRIIAGFCDQGDELAIETFRRTGHILGIGLANYASVINPEAIILAGGISRAGKWLLDPLRESFEKHVFKAMQGKVKIFVSNLENHTRDVLGASAVAWDVKEYSLFK